MNRKEQIITFKTQRKISNQMLSNIKHKFQIFTVLYAWKVANVRDKYLFPILHVH
jgi:hypothetical protein